jgi:MinD-like ATPase involved in chromosome partitioning or flagellar assembly
MDSAEHNRRRVIVMSPFGQHQVDLPVDVPAEGLLPDLLAMAGLHPSEVKVGPEGWRLEDAGGSTVSPGQTLAGHGIMPGDVIRLRGVQQPAPGLRQPAPPAPTTGRAGPGQAGPARVQPGGLASLGFGHGDFGPSDFGPGEAGWGDARPASAGPASAGPGNSEGSALLSRRVPRMPAPSAPPDDSRTPLQRTQAALPVRVGRAKRAVAAAGAYFQGPDSPLLGGITPDRLEAQARAAQSAATRPAGQPAAEPGRPTAGPDRPPAPGAPPAPGPGLLPHPAQPPHPRTSPPPGRHRLLPADLTVATAPSRMHCARARWRDLDYVGQLDARIAGPRLRHCATIAVVSPKGGVGKTTITALLGTLFSLLRRDPTVAVDTNPDFGSLGRVLTPDQSWYVDDLARLVAEDDELSLTALDSQLGRAIHGLLVVPAPTDPARMAALDEDAYRRVIARLKDFFSLILLDCGTGLQDPASAAAVAAADQVVLVTDAQPANASLVAQSAELLQQSGRPITVVVNRMPPKGARLDLDRLSRYLPAARGLVVIPDRVPAATQLAGGNFDWRDAPSAWQLAVRQLAVVLVADWRRLGLAQ